MNVVLSLSLLNFSDHCGAGAMPAIMLICSGVQRLSADSALLALYSTQGLMRPVVTQRVI